MRASWPLTGRTEELRVVADSLRATDGPGGIVIAGGPGVGKTRVALESVALARHGNWVVRWAVGTSSARSLPLGALGAWVDTSSHDHLGLVHSVIRRMSGAPPGRAVLVAVDDAHLLDDLSAYVLHQLVQRRLATVIVTLRSGEPVPDAVTALWKEGHLDRLELEPLSRQATDQLLTAVLGTRVAEAGFAHLWQLTRGNALYLRHLVEKELDDGRLSLDAGLWVWPGQPVVSSSLVELIEARIGELSAPVADVVDILTVGEPLDIGLLHRMTPPAAVEEAEARGLIIIGREPGGGPVVARVAHPLYGEVRRARMATLRLRRLRGRVAEALVAGDDGDDGDLRASVRRAALHLDSDLEPVVGLYLRAARGAMLMSDLGLAERLARAATVAAGGVEAQFLLAHVLSLSSRGREAEQLLAHLPAQDLSGRERAQIAFVRCANMLWTMGSPDAALNILESREDVDPDVMRSLTAPRVTYLAALGDPRGALDVAGDTLVVDLPDVVAMVTCWGLVLALGDVGRTSEATLVAARGFALAAGSPEGAFQQFVLGDTEVTALLLAGRVQDAQQVAATVRCAADALPGLPDLFAAGIVGAAWLGGGAVRRALDHLHHAVHGLSDLADTSGGRYRYLLQLTLALAMSGDGGSAAAALDEADRARHPAFAYLESDHGLVRGWVSAAGGATTAAITLARAAAEMAARRGQLTREVNCLQAATQFGDWSTAPRLTALSDIVEGPRAPAIAAFARALGTGDRKSLLAASETLESMGDVAAAADAAAHATMVSRRLGLSGSALTSMARAEALARRCEGLMTPALREAIQPTPYTRRQREVVQLVAHGLSNREIAERLCVSVRTVEGHLYRATVRAGVHDRRLLGATLSDSPGTAQSSTQRR